ncbi:hemolysin III family protein, partial [Klebsiella pneumoniae]|nr:hemolysin III family protein [Klebsiella pneumoniae]MBL3466781.1 hemolysin III family protein [Klebsiella pneumoniae]
NVNAGHERTSKARIIHQIQLIRGITMMIILTGSIFTAVEENLCAAASGFSDATAPGLTATSALTT